MSVHQEIESKRPALQELCNKIGVHGLRVKIDADSWGAVTFIADLDISKLAGYADRFFAVEEGLLKTFHRRIRFIDAETFAKIQNDSSHAPGTPEPVVELLHA